MRLIVKDDLDHVLHHYKTRRHSSYFFLSSLHGNSRSEYAAMLDDQTTRQLIDPASGVLLSIHAVDLQQGHARVQLCLAHGAVDLGAFLQATMIALQVTRLYSYLFADELCERQALLSMNFVQEAVFRQHVFLQSRYQDVLVFGLIGEHR